MSLTTIEVTRDPAVAAYVEMHDLSAALETALEIMGRHFPGCPVTVEIEADPDTGDLWLQVDVRVEGALQDIHRAHDDCDAEVFRAMRWPASVLVRTSYTAIPKS